MVTSCDCGYNFEIGCDVTLVRLHALLRVTLKCASFAVIPYTKCAFYGNSPEICNDITSNLKVGQSVGCQTGKVKAEQSQGVSNVYYVF